MQKPIKIIANWKSILIIFIILLCIQTPSFAVTEVKLQWDHSIDKPYLTSYKIYYDTDSRAPYNGTDAVQGNSPITVAIKDLAYPDNPQYQITGLYNDKVYYFAVKAVDTRGLESGYSNEVATVGFTVSAISGNTTEDGGTATFTVRLNTQPTEDVTIGVSSSDTTEGTVSPDSLTFTNVKWNANQTVTVTGVDDAIDDGNQSYTVVLAAAVSDDANYKNLNPDDVSVTNNDNDTASNNPPNQPGLSSPEDGAIDVSLTPPLITNAFRDLDEDAHAATLWKITNDNTSEVVFNVTSTVNLTSLNVPDFVLSGNIPYSWTVIFYDNNGASSSEATASFTTADEEPFTDNNSNGIPDDQEVADTVDLDGDGISDEDEIVGDPNNYKSVNTVDENDKVVGQIGISTADDISATIAMLMAVNPGRLPADGKPDDLPLGIVSFKLNVTPGAEVTVTIYLSKAAPSDAHWYKYSPASGWLDCTDRGYARFIDDDRTSLLLTLIDGGFGDADGLANGVIIDPSGFGTPSASSSSTPGSAGAASGGGCFIATAAYGSPLDKHVDILRRLRDNILLPTKWGQGLAKAYYHYSPPVADFIRDHDTARLMARWSLLPVVGLSWVALQIGAVSTLLLIFMVLSMGWLFLIKYRGLRHRVKVQGVGYKA